MRVANINILIEALEGGIARSKIRRLKKNSAPFTQQIIFYNLKEFAPALQKQTHLPGTTSIAAVTRLNGPKDDGSIRNHVYRDINPRLGYDLRPFIYHTKFKKNTRKRVQLRTMGQDYAPSAAHVKNQAIYRSVFGKSLSMEPQELKLLNGKNFPIYKIKQGGAKRKTDEQQRYEKVRLKIPQKKEKRRKRQI